MGRVSQFITSGQWYKGNTHLHTTVSDGQMSPEEAVNIYRNAGYHFLTVTDHNVYGIHENLQDENFVIFGGIEINTDLSHTTGFCHHVVFMATPQKTPFRHGQCFKHLRSTMDMQEIINYMHDNNHIAIYAHPRWSHVRMGEYNKLQGCMGVEIYNHVSEVVNGCGESFEFYEQPLWDGRRMFCFATDDAHKDNSYLGGYIAVKASDLTHKNIMAAIECGSFYASNGGPEIYDFYVEDRMVHIDCSPCSQVSFFADGSNGVNRVSSDNSLTCVSLDFDSVWLPGKGDYVFAVCTDDKGRRSWTQPIWTPLNY